MQCPLLPDFLILESARDLLQLQKFFTCSYREDKKTIQPGICLLNPMYWISIQCFHTEASPYFAVRDDVDFDVSQLLRNSVGGPQSAT
ncbi:hypothetical protein TNCV_4200471 [Trichonephila clavipes]|uniref:Uncharacterized protein n=1 Tax=Trichonephila clavipes TaxID=2585209 RepID=A0A8X6WBB6_TRICX|nr:hypothetical protein TNCV_4200471 [Trichonephila clavipes]